MLRRLEVHLEFERHLATEAVEHAISGLPIVACAVIGLADVLLVEEIFHITRDGRLVTTHIEGVACREVEQIVSRHLPRRLKVFHTVEVQVARVEGVVSIVVGEILPIESQTEILHWIDGEAKTTGELCRTSFFHVLLVEGHLSVVIGIDARSNLTLSICEGLTLRVVEITHSVVGPNPVAQRKHTAHGEPLHGFVVEFGFNTLVELVHTLHIDETTVGIARSIGDVE